MNTSPEKSPDLLHRPHFTKLRSPERSPIMTRRSRSHERSPDRARHLRQLKHRSLEIPHISSRSPDIAKRRSHYHEGSSELTDERLLDQASTPIPIPSKPPASSHSPSSSDATPEKSSPQGDDTIIEGGHVKTESEDSMGGGSEAVTPKLEEPPAPAVDQVRPDRSASVTGEVEQLPPLPEETLFSHEDVVLSPTLKVATADKLKETDSDVSKTSKPLDNEQLLFDMLSNKEGSTTMSRDESQAEEKETGQNEIDRTEKAEVADDILAELDEILDAEDAEDGEEGEEEEEEKDVPPDKTDAGSGEGKEEVQESDKPPREESDFSSDSVIPKEVESGHEHPVEVEGQHPSAGYPNDFKLKPPEVTAVAAKEPVSEVESAVPSQVREDGQLENEPKPAKVESGEPPTLEEVKTARVPPSVELEIQIEPTAEPVSTSIDSGQAEVEREPSKVEYEPLEVEHGQPEGEKEHERTESELVQSVPELSEDKGQPLLDEIQPLESKPELPLKVELELTEVPVKEEASKQSKEAVNTSTESTTNSQSQESMGPATASCEQLPASTESVDLEASGQSSVHILHGEVEKPTESSITKEQVGSTSDVNKMLEDSPAKSEGQVDQITESEREIDHVAKSTDKVAVSEGHTDQGGKEDDEVRSDQMVTDDQVKSEHPLEKEDSMQESDER